MQDTAHTNHLIDETSPYLQQHARNPVQWYPWGEAALARARRENKPILLSIGYSACHWCHVMAHESFEDENTARVMNELFVNIKVDREERPDLDKIYQQAYQLLNQRSGGWPLTMFLTPDDRMPFFGATYVPKEPRYGMPSFVNLMRRLTDFYRTHMDQVREQNASLRQAFAASAKPRQANTGYALNPAPLQESVEQLACHFDSAHGGFGQAPKFPSPINIEHLLRHWSRTTIHGEPDPRAETMALTTLRKMALGGIYDQLGGGFYRYSVDERWMIPHFEKMLYDNGPLLALYSEAWQATGDALFKAVCEQTGTWTMREMQSPEGGYFSSLDADSEGEEGKFYVWTRTEARALLTSDEFAVLAAHYGLDQVPNFEDRWHLRVCRDSAEVAGQIGLNPVAVTSLLASARDKLFAAREQRARPARDEKILTAWNGLMIKGMATAGRLLGRADFTVSAGRALDFVREHLWRHGRLLATYKDGKAHLAGYLDDYAFLIDGIIALLQVRWRDADLELALALADVLLERFQDRKGGFYFTADDHETLIHRPRPLYDDALPAGNGIAAGGLLKLGRLLSSMRYLVAAERVLKWAWPSIERAPMACNGLLSALEEYYYPGQTIILRGTPETMAVWRERCNRGYAPRRLTLAIPSSKASLPEGLARKAPDTGNPTAYICSGTQCSPPITRLADLDRALTPMEVGASPPTR
jgi:uncharacterized protein YyaL (SSP411 family)